MKSFSVHSENKQDSAVVASNRAYKQLTNSQLMIWMGQQLEPKSPLYNMILCFRFDRALNSDHFQRAFSKLVKSSDAMRTVYKLNEGVPVQFVLESLDYLVEEIDFTHCDNPNEEKNAWIKAHNEQNFELSSCSFESTLLKVAENEYYWYFNQHHLSMDIWSTAVMCKNVSFLYQASLAGNLETSNIDCPAWADYIAYENEVRNSVNGLKAAAYWKEQSKKSIAPICFYANNPKQKRATTRRVACELGELRTCRLKKLAAADGFRGLSIHSTLFNIFLVTLCVWIYRVSGRQDIAIGSPAHNRSSTHFRKTLGLFIELFPLYITLDKGQSFRSLFSTVISESMNWLRYAQPGTSSTEGARQFNVVLNYIHTTFEPFSDMPTKVEWLHAGAGDPRHDLRLQVHDLSDEDNFLLYFDFNIDTFTEVLQQNAVNHFLAMLDGFLENPDAIVDHVPLIDMQESQRYISDFNRTETIPRSTSTILELFAQQVEKTPDEIAVVQDDRTLTYRELDHQSDLLAGMLKDKNVKTDILVGVFLKRSIELMIAIWGILKSGGGFVPLESGLPIVRLKYLIKDTALDIVLTDSSLMHHLKDLSIDTLCMDAPFKPSDDFILTRPLVNDVAYVIYTSGSTGYPKGVVIEHQGLHEYISWAVNTYTGNKPNSFALYSSIGFDLTITSLFVPLVCGGCVYVYQEQDTMGDLSVLNVFADNQVDTVKLTPAHLRLILDSDVSESRVTTLILGGENLKSALCHRALQMFPKGLRIINEYGPTEGVVGCMEYRYDATKDKDMSVPIGQPADNTKIYVLDAGLNPVPVGVSGEIYISRIGIARGYHGRKDLTDGRFVANPFEPETLMYKTGDLARFRDDMMLEYLGRIDEQVKIRGVRLEVAEVENVLQLHPEVQHSSVQITQPYQELNSDTENYCVRCGIASNYPGVSFNASGVCNICLDYDAINVRARDYFGTSDQLQQLFDDIKNSNASQYDCIALLSGGKDSTYALAKVVDMGMKVLAFTLDNGFISNAAKDNIKRVTDHLNVDHVFAKEEHMNEIFVDSLERHSNVCQGCFKVIYTLSMQLALEKNIPSIVTGLSRGQFFETRLTADIFRDEKINIATIDKMVADARKAYHRVDDAVSQLMDVSDFRKDDIFERIRFIDFYRYNDVSLTEMMAYLDHKLPWVRPSDTGRSTNCLINDSGIYVHKRKTGFHNYALPYSWDVRLGVKNREQAIDELNDDIDVSEVYRNLEKIGYQEGRFFSDPDEKKLVAYFTSEKQLDATVLRQWCSQHLSQAAIPTQFIQIDKIPLTRNGKVDSHALPKPSEQRPQLEHNYLQPRSDIEKLLVRLWENALGIEPIGVHDNYFDLGGDSIVAIQIVGRAAEFDIAFPPNQIFVSQTIAELAKVAVNGDSIKKQNMPLGKIPLTPIQQWYFSQHPADPDYFSQAVLLDVDETIASDHIMAAIKYLMTWHESLRLCFTFENDQWVQELKNIDPVFSLSKESIPSEIEDYQSLLKDTEQQLTRSLSLSEGRLVAATIFEDKKSDRLSSRKRQLLIVIHHLVVDVVSWIVFIDHLDSACKQLSNNQPILFPIKSSSIAEWSELLQQKKNTSGFKKESNFWDSVDAIEPYPNPTEMTVESSRCSMTLSVSAHKIQPLLDHSITKWDMRIQEVILSALVLSVLASNNKNSITVHVESHGREAINDTVDISRTVGWFSSIYPILFELDTSLPIDELMRHVKSLLTNIPQNGIGYGLLHWGNKNKDAINFGNGIVFNFLGNVCHLLPSESKFQFVKPISVNRSPTSYMPFAWDIYAWIDTSGLQIVWEYSRAAQDISEMNMLIDMLEEKIHAFVDCCETRRNSGFMMDNLDNHQLDKLAGLLGKD